VIAIHKFLKMAKNPCFVLQAHYFGVHRSESISNIKASTFLAFELNEAF